MAITSIDLPRVLSFDIARQIARTAPGLRPQSRDEIFQCLDIVQIWQDWIEDSFGILTKILHRSQPDDPPDLELVFADGRVVAMEHTKLLPQHLGEAEAWLRQSGQGGGLPSISSPPATTQELRDIVAGIRPAWSNVVDDWRAIFYLLKATLRKKMRGMPGGGIIGIVCDLFVVDEHEKLLAQLASDIVNRTEFSDFANYILLILNRSTPSVFYSALVKRLQQVHERRGTPPPLTPEDEELLAEIRATEAQLGATEN